MNKNYSFVTVFIRAALFCILLPFQSKASYVNYLESEYQENKSESLLQKTKNDLLAKIDHLEQKTSAEIKLLLIKAYTDGINVITQRLTISYQNYLNITFELPTQSLFAYLIDRFFDFYKSQQTTESQSSPKSNMNFSQIINMIEKFLDAEDLENYQIAFERHLNILTTTPMTGLQIIEHLKKSPECIIKTLVRS